MPQGTAHFDDSLDMKNSIAISLAILLFIFSFALNLYNNGFDYYLHHDEPKKVKFIKEGTQDFMHPTLMLKLSKLIKKITGEENEQKLAIAGRSVSAFMGACIVMASFFLALRLLSALLAFLAGLSVSVSPILVVHSHYLKEDVYFTATLLLSLLFFIKWLESNRRSDCILFGLAFGLALSSQYKSLIFLLITLLAPLLDRTLRNKRYAKELSIALTLSAIIFLIINYNIFINSAIAYNGVSHELEHIRTGHSLIFHPLDDFFLFHYKNSLVPGLTLAATVIATIGFFISIFGWKFRKLPERLLLACIVVFYLAHEISPLKPAPDFMRYMLPIAPMLLLIGWLGVERAYRLLRMCTGRLPGYALLAVAAFSLLLFPAYDSANIVANLVDDTRISAAAFIYGLGEGYIYEAYALPRYGDQDFVESAADIDIGKAADEGICHVLTSSMEYNRYYYGLKCANQKEEVYRRHRGYERLFQYPYVEIHPKYKTFAFSNPVIRIIDICAEAQQ
jgi:hypothetical protein